MGFDVCWNAVLIACKMRFLCLSVLVNLHIVNIVQFLVNNEILTLYFVCSKVSASPIVELNRIQLEPFEIMMRVSSIPKLASHSFTALMASAAGAKTSAICYTHQHLSLSLSQDSSSYLFRSPMIGIIGTRWIRNVHEEVMAFV